MCRWLFLPYPQLQRDREMGNEQMEMGYFRRVLFVLERREREQSVARCGEIASFMVVMQVQTLKHIKSELVWQEVSA